MKTIMKSQIINADDRFVSYTPILLEDLNYPTKTTDNEKFTVKVELYLNTKEINYVGNVYLYLDGNLVKTTKLYRYY